MVTTLQRGNPIPGHFDETGLHILRPEGGQPVKAISPTRLRNRVLFAALAGFLWSGWAHAQLNGSDIGMSALAKSWGYYQGQIYRLDRVEKHYPDLQANVFIARQEFTAAFPDFEENVRRTFLSWGAKEEDVVSMRKSMMDSLTPMIDREPIGRESAQVFVETVRQRAKGKDIPEDILQYLLATAFMDRPEQEISRGWREEFTTLNHPKAKGVTVQLKLPKSFKRQEGNRPNVVSKWTSEAGNGIEILMLIVLNSEDNPLSRKQIEDDIQLGDRSEIKQSLKDAGTVVSLRPFTQELAAGYIAETQSDLERAGLETSVRQLQFVLFTPGHTIMFSCHVGARRGEALQLESRMKRLSGLCRQVANSLVLPQQYVGGQ